MLCVLYREMHLFENISVLETFTVCVTKCTSFFSIHFQSEDIETKNKYIQAVCPKGKSKEFRIFNISNYLILIYTLFQFLKPYANNFINFLFLRQS